MKLIQEKVDDWIKKYGVRYFNELTNMALLSEEVGEVAKIMAQMFGEQNSKKIFSKEDLADELADVLFVIACIANQTGINLDIALEKNIEKKTNRDFNRHKLNKKLNN